MLVTSKRHFSVCLEFNSILLRFSLCTEWRSPPSRSIPCVWGRLQDYQRGCCKDSSGRQSGRTGWNLWGNIMSLIWWARITPWHWIFILVYMKFLFVAFLHRDVHARHSRKQFTFCYRCTEKSPLSMDKPMRASIPNLRFGQLFYSNKRTKISKVNKCSFLCNYFYKPNFTVIVSFYSHIYKKMFFIFYFLPTASWSPDNLHPVIQSPCQCADEGLRSGSSDQPVGVVVCPPRSLWGPMYGCGVTCSLSCCPALWKPENLSSSPADCIDTC